MCAWVGVHVCALRSGVTHTFCVRFCGTPSIQVSPLLFSESVHGGEHCHWSTCHRCFLPCRHLGSFIPFFRHGKLLASAAGPLSSAAGPLSSAAGPLSSAQWPPSVADVVCPAAFLGVSVTVLARRDVRSTTLRGEGLRAVGGQPAGPSIIVVTAIAVVMALAIAVVSIGNDNAILQGSRTVNGSPSAGPLIVVVTAIAVLMALAIAFASTGNDNALLQGSRAVNRRPTRWAIHSCGDSDSGRDGIGDSVDRLAMKM